MEFFSPINEFRPPYQPKINGIHARPENRGYGVGLILGSAGSFKKKWTRIDLEREALTGADQYLALPGVRGNGIASRTLARPVT